MSTDPHTDFWRRRFAGTPCPGCAKAMAAADYNSYRKFRVCRVCPRPAANPTVGEWQGPGVAARAVEVRAASLARLAAQPPAEAGSRYGAAPPRTDWDSLPPAQAARRILHLWQSGRRLELFGRALPRAGDDDGDDGDGDD